MCGPDTLLISVRILSLPDALSTFIWDEMSVELFQCWLLGYLVQGNQIDSAGPIEEVMEVFSPAVSQSCLIRFPLSEESDVGSLCQSA